MKSRPTFETLRLKLIDVSRKRAEKEIGIPRSGFGVSRRLLAIDEYTYWSNAKDVLIELMNLKAVKEAPVPSKRNHVPLHRNRSYELTTLGETLLEELEKDELTFREKLLELMYRHHSHLRSLVKVLEKRDIHIPIYKLEGRFDNPNIVSDATLIDDAIAWIRERAEQFDFPHIDFLSLHAKLKAKARNGQEMPKTNLLNAINESVESAFLKACGLSFDNVTFEHLYRLGQQTHIINYGYLRNGRSSNLVVFSTAEINEQPTFQVVRHIISDYEQKVVEVIPSEFQSFGESFAPIHDLRIKVCHKLKINNEIFNYVISKLFKQSYEVDYQIVLLRDMPGVLPPSAEPLKINNDVYFTIALMRKKEVS
jgi:hypothetical protein